MELQKRNAGEENMGKDARAAYQVVLFSEDGRMKSQWLPKNREGIYYVGGESQNDCLLFLEGKGNCWVARCNKNVYFGIAREIEEQRITIENRVLYPLYAENKKYLFYMEKVTEKSYVFHHYLVKENTQLLIGRSISANIVYENAIVSKEHAILSYMGGNWYLEDIGSSNGVYLNDRRIARFKLKPMDRVYIWGLILIVGYGYLAINDEHEGVYITGENIRRTDVKNVGGLVAETGDGQELFDRKPRKQVGFPKKEIKLEAPPASMKNGDIPMMLRLGSSLAMGAGNMLSGNSMMMVSSVMFPFLNQKYTEKEREKYEELRTKKYTEYLREKRQEIQDEIRYEKKMRDEQFPRFEEILAIGMQGERLWERRNIDEDFLVLRLGTGDVPMEATIKYPEERFHLDDDELEDEMYGLAQGQYKIQNTAVNLSLVEHIVSGIAGEHEEVLCFAKILIMQTAVLHSYDEVKMIILADDADMEQLEFARFLPHMWDDQKNIRFMATKPGEAYQIGEVLKKEAEDDLSKNGDKLKEILKKRPFYLIFAFDKKLFDSMELLKTVVKKEENIGISTVALFPKLPKECTAICTLQGSGIHQVTYLREGDREADTFQMETFDERTAENVMHKLSNTSLMLISQEYALPKMVTFLEMYGVGRVEHLNPLNRWMESNPIQSLSAPVGVATDGSLFCLDLHEKYQGPHGLIAGMTGSGKSEFIITYILSMAVNYHPDEVAFVLIDYKGGGLAGAFDDPARGIHLPHLAGTMTNLDGAAIQRSMMSIESELKRRQRVFNEAKSIANEGTMDIYTYQKLRRQGVVKEAVPHLFIISDEFAELKTQEPDFMNQLISTARIGRSLGVHLILATQKPAGVVNDQIVSNTKFRVCLRVQDKMDSMDMLKRPEAAELRDTGRFYLQVGYNEFFALGQSAWCGAPYEAQDRVVTKRDDTVRFIDMAGQSILTTKPETKKQKATTTQIVSIVKLLSDLAIRENIQPRLLWKDPLPDRIPLELERKDENGADSDSIRYCVGMADDPENQKQFPYWIDLIKMQNLLIVGDKASGKTTLLQSMLLSLSARYTPEDVNYYILDYSSRSLKLFQKLPHCGAVLLEEEAESLSQFFRLIGEIIAERKKLYAELEVSTFEGCRSIQKLPLILVVIDNFVGLKQSKLGEDLYMKFSEYLKEGGAYGIRYIMTANASSELWSRTRQEIDRSLALHLKDRFEYGEVLNCRCRYEPPEKKGRGMCRIGERPLEYQAAIFHPETAERDRIPEVKKELERIAQFYQNQGSAKKLPQIREEETYEEFAAQFGKRRLPLGYAIQGVKPVALPMQQFNMLSLYFGNPQSVLPVMKNMVYWSKKEEAKLILVKREADSVFLKTEKWKDDLKDAQIWNSEKEEITKLWNELADLVKERRELFHGYCDEKEIDLATPGLEKEKEDFMREATRPVIVLMERFLDVCSNKDESAEQIFTTLFGVLRLNNIYFIGGFYPGDGEVLYSESMAKKFNPDSLIMMFGGQLDKQGLISLPYEYEKMREPGKYNRCLMEYRKKLYALFVPCGLPEEAKQDGDERSIFD